MNKERKKVKLIINEEKQIYTDLFLYDDAEDDTAGSVVGNGIYYSSKDSGQSSGGGTSQNMYIVNA